MVIEGSGRWCWLKKVSCRVIVHAAGADAVARWYFTPICHRTKLSTWQWDIIDLVREGTNRIMSR